MKRSKCAYLGKDGICKNEAVCNRFHRRPECLSIKKCERYKNSDYLRKKHDAEAHDRPLTQLTRILIKRYFEEGDSVLQIAIVLDRSTAVIEEVLKDEIRGFGMERGNRRYSRD